MVLPGYNVSEPIGLAIKLYEVVESLRNAPESAKAFVSKINNFSGNLKDLQRILEKDTASHSTQDLDHLRATVLECQACVKRCEEYSEAFGKLTKDGRGKMDGAGQAARWTLQKEKVARLREEVDTQMNSIGLTLSIQSLCVGFMLQQSSIFGRPKLTNGSGARQDSRSATEGLSPPIRSGTLSSLPPYSSPQPNWTPTDGLQHPKAPADLLNLDTERKRKTSEADIPNFELVLGGSDGKNIIASPQMSPTTLRPSAEQDELSQLDAKGAMKPLELRRNTNNEVAASPTGLGLFSALSEGSGTSSQIFTSPTISSRRTSNTEVTTSTSRRDSIFAPESAVVEMAMENLDGVQACYYKANSRRSYPVSMIESLRDEHTGRRYIVISPPTSSKVKLYFVPPTERIIAHSEHPQAYGSTTKHRVKFIEPYILRSQKISSERRSPDISSVSSPSLAPVSSTTSVASSRSLGSPVLTTNNGVLKEESQCQEYDFENRDDYLRFQEMLMGPDVKLQLQVPVQSITSKKYEERRPTEESKLQYLRLWQFSGCQTMMFFANLSSNKYREYKMENLRPVELKSKTTIRLEVHLPGMVRRRSSSKTPLIIPKPLAQEQARFGAYTDENDMSNLDYLSLEFNSADDRTAFLHKASFHSSAEEPTASPFALHSKSPSR